MYLVIRMADLLGSVLNVVNFQITLDLDARYWLFFFSNSDSL